MVCTGDCTKEQGNTESDDTEVPDTDCECDYPEPAFAKDEYKGRDVRQIVSGIREFWPEYEELVGNYGLYILNLEPRKIRGVMSHGMLMAVDGVDGKPVFLGPQGEINPGSKVR